MYTSSVYIMIPSLDWFNYVERKLMFYVYIHVIVCLYVYLIYIDIWFLFEFNFLSFIYNT